MGRWLCFILLLLSWLLLAGGVLQGCELPTPCSGDGIGPLHIDPHGYPCQSHCECNNQRFHGECVQGRCRRLKERVACTTMGQSLEVRREEHLLLEMCPALSSPLQRRCTTATFTKTCQPPSLNTKVWSDCLCTGKLCPEKQVLCGRSCSTDKPCACIDLQKDTKHCGGCGITCKEGEVCTKGSCNCPSNRVVCNGACVDLQKDAKHCGSCAVVCKDGSLCAQGRCQEVLLKPGSYLRGTPSKRVDWDALQKAHGVRKELETPHLTTLTRPFFLGRFEVSQGWFEEVMGYNPATLPCSSDKKNCPAHGITLSRAMDFCNRLSVQRKLPICYLCENSGKSNVLCKPDPRYKGKSIYDCKGFRLPTDAEWEWAARAGRAEPFPGGTPTRLPMTPAGDYGPWVQEYAWYRGNAGGILHATGTKKANSWGLYDLQGSVAEWVWNGALEFLTASTTDPVGVWDASKAVVRGGSILSVGVQLRAGIRQIVENPHEPRKGVGRHPIGFRIARTAPFKPLCSKSGLSDCGGAVCVDTRNSDRHCGVCGNACKVFSRCVAGHCVRSEIKVNTKGEDGKPKIWIMGAKIYPSYHTDQECFRQNTSPFRTGFLQDYWMGVYEVRQRDFAFLMGFNPSHNLCKNCPVDSVTWHQTLLYANKLSKYFGFKTCFQCSGDPTGTSLFCSVKPEFAGKNYYNCPGYRLPTSAEWEFAANVEATRQSFCEGLSANWDWAKIDRELCGYSGSSKKQSFCYPNPLGFYDMQVSLREWVWDGFSLDHPVGIVGTVLNYIGQPSAPDLSCYRCGGLHFPLSKKCYRCFRELRGQHYLNIGPSRAATTLRYFSHVYRLSTEKITKTPARVVGFRVVRSELSTK